MADAVNANVDVSGTGSVAEGAGPPPAGANDNGRRKGRPVAAVGTPSASELVTMIVRGEHASGRDLRAGTALVDVLDQLANPVRARAPRGAASLRALPGRVRFDDLHQGRPAPGKHRRRSQVGRGAPQSESERLGTGDARKLQERETAGVTGAAHQDVTVPEVLEELLADIRRGRPGAAGEARDRGTVGAPEMPDGETEPLPGDDRFRDLCRRAERLVECFGNRRLGDFGRVRLRVSSASPSEGG